MSINCRFRKDKDGVIVTVPGDPILKINDREGYVSPIERWLSTKAVAEHYNQEEIEALRTTADRYVTLDPIHDEQLPDWAYDILRMPGFSYRGKIKICVTHAEDILHYKALRNKQGEKPNDTSSVIQGVGGEEAGTQSV